MTDTKFYVDEDGVYLGGYDGDPPTGAFEVAGPPPIHAMQIWDFTDKLWLPLSDEQLRKIMLPIDRMTLMLGLLGIGITENSIDETLNALPQSSDVEKLKIKFKNADYFPRLEPEILMLAEVLSVSAEQLDTIWSGSS